MGLFRVLTLSDGEASAMMALIEKLFPICRSITGDSVRQTLKITG